ncbi:MAG: exo-alpha-sialidase [Chloroflexi bacterium]|nr:exo-alpha-sialidase [Chloroflexota bacterium]MCI0579117.1 exo-alpha-sialidase [Chloroflexota bacterium]MCI0643334.1 exo-alpha-sialidase [Chloroflexota bacterium]MCI0728313.1 exo-alpha-sialidase [Chloroflexota bacterium]
MRPLYAVLLITLLSVACSSGQQNATQEAAIASNPAGAPAMDTAITATSVPTPERTAPAVRIEEAPAATSAPTMAAPTVTPLLPPVEATLPAEGAAFAVAGDGTIYVVAGDGDRNVLVYRSTDGFGEPVLINPGKPAFTAPAEVPGVIAYPDGRVGVTWLELLGHEASIIWYAESADGGQMFGNPVQVNDQTQGHQSLPRIVAGENNLLVAWLNRAGLFRAISQDGGESFLPTELLDEEVCNCCRPELVVAGNRVILTYRNVERDENDREIRDIYVATSEDGGQTFQEPLRVSDAPWYLNSCPSSGPVIATHDDTVYVAFMDGRNDDGSQTRADIYLATSTDGGQSFSPNVRVNPAAAGFHSLAALAVGPDGALHVTWQAIEDNRQKIYYATSNDDGLTFSQPQVIVENGDDSGRGRPNHPTVYVDQAGRVYLMWLDKLGAHLISL